MVLTNSKNFRCAAVVPAAGLSLRMGAFKPLLDLSGKPLICRTLDSLRAAGCCPICVVTGHRAEELETAAAAPDVLFARNPDYARTGMLESVQLGLSVLCGHAVQDRLSAEVSEGEFSKMGPAAHAEAKAPVPSSDPAEIPYDFVFILPGDIPLVSHETMQALKSAAEKLPAGSAVFGMDEGPGRASKHSLSDVRIFRPSCCGKAGHPVLMNAAAARELLRYRGPDGLRGFIRQFEKEDRAAAGGGPAEPRPAERFVRVIPCEDPGILADADTPQDYADLLRQLRESGDVSPDSQTR